jgi:superfamily II DNA or RNA helicase
MVSEGVDIPRLRIGVYATTTTTELFFRQAVGRFVRWRPGLARQQAYVFLPDDIRLRRHAFGIAEQRRHSLVRREREEEEPLDEPAVEQQAPDDGDQLSLFAAISATALHAPDDPAPAFDDVPAMPEADDDGTLAVPLAPPPPLPGHDETGGGDGPTETRTARKRRLRTANTGKVRTLARVTGLDHQKVNLELNRRSGLQSISQATVEQLERRLEVADDWLRRL